jgi:hypothetical protein
VIEKQKKERRLMKISVGEGIDLFITFVCREKMRKKEKKLLCTAIKKLRKEKWINVPFPMI